MYDKGVAVERSQLEGKKAAKTIQSSRCPDAESSIYVGGSSAAEKMRRRFGRIRNTQKAEMAEARLRNVTVRTLKRMRGKQPPDVLWSEVARSEKFRNSDATESDHAIPTQRSNECVMNVSIPERVIAGLAAVAGRPKCSNIGCCKFGCDGKHD